MQWKDYVAEISRTGLSQSQLAKQAGCGQATISDLVSGRTKEPRHSLGVALMRIGKRQGVKTTRTIQPSVLADQPQAGEAA